MRVATGKCRCGNLAGKKVSPTTKLKVCRKCFRKDSKKKKPPKKKKEVYDFREKYPVRKPAVLLPTYKGFEGTKAEEFCTNLRANLTGAERRFKFMMGLTEIPFVPQYPIKREDIDSFYIIDFYVPGEGLCIELDGGYHDTKEQRLADKTRDEFLKSKGYRVVRLTNEKVFKLNTVKSFKSFLKL
jgi:very-short-patch-repair endonuclease